MPIKGRPRLIAKAPSSTKLFVDDLREVVRLSATEKKHLSDTLRELVHESLRTRRLEAIGRDSRESGLLVCQHEKLIEGLRPLQDQLAALPPFLSGQQANAEAILAQLLCHLLVIEYLTKTMMTVSMERDEMRAEEIRAQMNTQDEMSMRQAQQLWQKLLAARGGISTQAGEPS